MLEKEKLLESIRPGMQLTEAFMLQIYAYSVTDPYYAGIALDYLDGAMCSGARDFYRETVYKWKAKHDAEMDRAAAWYRRQVEKEQRKEEEGCRKEIDQMSEAEAKAALKKMMHC